MFTIADEPGTSTENGGKLGNIWPDSHTWLCCLLLSISPFPMWLSAHGSGTFNSYCQTFPKPEAQHNSPSCHRATSTRKSNRNFDLLSLPSFKMSVAGTINSARKIELWKVCENIFLWVGILKIPGGGDTATECQRMEQLSNVASEWDKKYYAEMSRETGAKEKLHIINFSSLQIPTSQWMLAFCSHCFVSAAHLEYPSIL